jgi:hypothetical protein
MRILAGTGMAADEAQTLGQRLANSATSTVDEFMALARNDEVRFAVKNSACAYKESHPDALAAFTGLTTEERDNWLAYLLTLTPESFASDTDALLLAAAFTDCVVPG